MQTFSYHNHSNFSDGENSAEEMVLAAREAGLETFGLSDHFVIWPDGTTPGWAIPQERFDEYFRVMRELKVRYSTDTFKVKIGVEADFFKDSIELVRQKLAIYQPDYIIGAVHATDDLFEIDNAPEDWVPLSQDDIDQVWRNYWVKYLDATRCDLFTFFAHLDLPKKYKFMPSFDYMPMALKALDGVRQSGRPMELNTAGWYKDCHEQYPSLALLKQAKEWRIPVFISADAHSTDHILRGFNEASELLESL